MQQWGPSEMRLGVRERIVGGDGAGGARVVYPQQQQQQQVNENVFAAAGARQAGRCSSSSHAAAASSIMQPLPLASRYVGAAKHDSVHPASSALGSTWIRRFLPSSPDEGSGELGQEAAHAPRTVSGAGSTHHPGPLLLAPAPTPHREQQDVQITEAAAAMAIDSTRETTPMVSGNVQYLRKGKAPQERDHRVHESTTTETAGHDWRKNDSIPSVHRNVHRPRSHVVVEGTTSRQQPQVNQGSVFSTRGVTHPVVTGFGSLRVMRNLAPAPPSIDHTKVVGGSSINPGLRAAPWMEGKTSTEARDLPAAAATAAVPSHPSSQQPSAIVLDRRATGATPMMVSQAGTKFTYPVKTEMAKDLNLGSEAAAAVAAIRPSIRAVGFASGAWGFPKAVKKKETEPDTGRPSGSGVVVQTDAAVPVPFAVAGSNQGELSSARLNPFGDIARSGPESRFHEVSDHGAKMGGSKLGERFVSSFPPANLGGRKEDGGQATDSRQQYTRAAAAEASARPSSGAGFPTGVDSRKAKEIQGCGLSNVRDVGTSQVQHSPENLAWRQFQGESSIGKVGHPLPYSPHSSFGGDENSGEESRGSRGREELTKSRVDPPDGAPKSYQDGLDGRAGQSARQAPWASLYNAFEGPKHPEPPNLTSSTATLTPDVHPKVHEGSIPANHPSEDPRAGGNREGRNEASLPASSAEARSRFDNQSSHFSSSPWPENESHNPNDDTGSDAYNSQATGSGYNSQSSRVPKHTASHSTRVEDLGRYRYDRGGAKEVSETPARSRDLSAGGPDLRKSASHEVEGGNGPPTLSKDYQAHGSQKDDTSGSAPPPYPPGYNSSESPVLGWGFLNRVGQSRRTEVTSEMEGTQVPRSPQGCGSATAGVDLSSGKGKRDLPERNTEAGHKDYMDAEKGQATVRDKYYEVGRPGKSFEVGETGLKHGTLRTSGEAMGEVGIVGPSKRSRHHPSLGSSDLGGSGLPPSELRNRDETIKPSSWLMRWMPPPNGIAAKPPYVFARPKDHPRNGLAAESPSGTGSKTFMGSSGGKSIDEQMGEACGKRIEEGSRMRNSLKDLSAKSSVNGFPSYPPPSAAAMALLGTAARKMAPLPQQRRGSISMWPSVPLQTVQAPEGQRSSSSTEHHIKQ